jgi:hypothetical protein
MLQRFRSTDCGDLGVGSSFTGSWLRCRARPAAANSFLAKRLRKDFPALSGLSSRGKRRARSSGVSRLHCRARPTAANSFLAKRLRKDFPALSGLSVDGNRRPRGCAIAVESLSPAYRRNENPSLKGFGILFRRSPGSPSMVNGGHCVGGVGDDGRHLISPLRPGLFREYFSGVFAGDSFARKKPKPG